VEIPDAEATTCLGCHEGLDKAKVAHAPVAGGMCASCHEFSGQGEETRVALAGGAVSDNTTPLCLTCHEDVGSALKAANGHVPAASGDCASCHSPHGSDHPKLMKAPERELCATCHDDVGQELQKKVVHAPATAACGVCHNPHGSPNPMLLREVPNALCVACHSAPLSPPGARTVPPVLLGRDHEVPASALPQGMRLRLDARGRGHPVADHPTSAAADPLRRGRPFTCVSCHSPHGANAPRLVSLALKPGEGICEKCHQM